MNQRNVALHSAEENPRKLALKLAKKINRMWMRKCDNFLVGVEVNPGPQTTYSTPQALLSIPLNQYIQQHQPMQINTQQTGVQPTPQAYTTQFLQQGQPRLSVPQQLQTVAPTNPERYNQQFPNQRQNTQNYQNLQNGQQTLSIPK